MANYNKTCSIEGCGISPVVAHGWCQLHYNRWRSNGDPEIVRRPKFSQEEQMQWLKAHINYSGDECLMWPFHRYLNGYCLIYIPGGKATASRLFCQMVHGDPPEPHYEASHSCGKGANGCISPAHLRWLTPKENQAERVIHGTANRGTRHGIAKLNDAAVMDIYRRVMRGEVQTAIAEDYDVSQTAISEIKTGKCWSWLTGAAP